MLSPRDRFIEDSEPVGDENIECCGAVAVRGAAVSWKVGSADCDGIGAALVLETKPFEDCMDKLIIVQRELVVGSGKLRETLSELLLTDCKYQNCHKQATVLRFSE